MAPLRLVQTLDGHTDRVWCVRWNSEGTQLASCSADKTIRLWAREGDKWQCSNVLTEGHTRTVRSVSWISDGSLLASASFDATTCIWSRNSDPEASPQWECDINLEGHENEVKCVEWAPSTRFLATCSRDKTVWIWERLFGDDFECASVLNEHSQDVKRVAWHPTRDILASCSYDNSIKLYQEDVVRDDWVCFASLDSHTSTVWGIAFNKDGTRLVSCSDDKTVKIWQSFDKETVRDWKLIATLSGYHRRAIYDVAWDWETDCIATADGDNSICVFAPDCSDSSSSASTLDSPTISYNLVTREENAHNSDVNSIRWNPAIPGLLASCGDDETVKLWSFSPEL